MRPQGRERVVWLAILMLATMRTPFMATDAFFPVLRLAVLVAPMGQRPWRALVPIVLCWCTLALRQPGQEGAAETHPTALPQPLPA